MTVDAILAILHHLAAFTLVAALATEFFLLRGRLDGEVIQRFGTVDILFGISAGAVLVIGVLRVILGAVGPEYYVGNLFFWLKMAAFAAVALVSIRPTVLGIRWRRELRGNPAFTPPPGEVSAIRRSLTAEVVVLPIIPTAAALMARGYGAL